MGFEDKSNNSNENGVGMIALHCLVVRQDIEHKGVDDKRVIAFFEKQNSIPLKLDQLWMKYHLDDYVSEK
jgi:hypothetical protein